MKYQIISIMKNFLFLLMTVPLFSFSQVNCDTLMIDPPEGEYTSDRTRGYLSLSVFGSGIASPWWRRLSILNSFCMCWLTRTGLST